MFDRDETNPEAENPRFAETALVHRFSIRFFFAWYDWWIGAYWDRSNRLLYLCPLPMVGVKLRIPREPLKRLLGLLKVVRQSWLFVPALVTMGVVMGIDIGVVLSRSDAAPVMSFSPLSSAPAPSFATGLASDAASRHVSSASGPNTVPAPEPSHAHDAGAVTRSASSAPEREEPSANELPRAAAPSVKPPSPFHRYDSYDSVPANPYPPDALNKRR